MKKLTKLIIYFVYLTIAALILVECCLRIFGFHSDGGNTIIDHHSLLGWIFKPNQVAICVGLEWKVKYSVNEYGIREKTNIGKKQDGVYRVLVLGDSFTEGFGIPQDKRYTHLAEILCNKRDSRKVEIINAGIRGYNLTQYYLLFQILYGKYNPDLVVIAAVHGDLKVKGDAMAGKNVVFGKEKYSIPYYILEDEKIVLKGVPVPLPDKSAYTEGKLEVLKKYLKKSTLYCFVRSAYRNNTFIRKIINWSYPEHFFDEKMLSNTPDDMQAEQQIAKLIIENMKSVLSHDNNKIAIFLLFDDSAGYDVAFYSKIAKELQIPYMCFSEVNDKYKLDKSKHHFKYDGHLNEKGNVLVAESLYNFFEQCGMFDSS
ncbi:MAG: SGNH/GDSL hydrolase family protein [Candidatus Omnitrophota bacterium]